MRKSFVIVLTSFAMGCAADSSRDTMTVVAAASLREPLTELAERFEKQHRSLDVRLSFAGSHTLRMQLEHGLQADVFVSADAIQVEALVASGHLVQPTTLAQSKLAVIVPRNNPADVHAFDDLRRASRLVVGDPDAPVGRYTASMFARLRRDHPALADQIEQNVVSHENNAQLVRAKVELGEADAAIVYDAQVREHAVSKVAIPGEINVRADYFIAALVQSTSPNAAHFVEFATGPGRQVMREHGYDDP